MLKGALRVESGETSGNGHRDTGPTALNVYTEWKTVLLDYSGGLQRADSLRQVVSSDGSDSSEGPILEAWR